MPAITGMVRTTGVANGMARIGNIPTATGVGGTVTGGVITTITWCSLAALAFHGGGAGAGALGPGVGAGTTATHTTATAIILMAMVAPTPTGTITATATDTAPNTSTVSTVVAANPESPSCNNGCHGLAIITDPSMESLGRRLVAQSGISSKQTATWANRRIPVTQIVQEPQ